MKNHRKAIFSGFARTALIFACGWLPMPSAAQAQISHFRGASISWAPTGNADEVAFHVTYASRLSQSNVPANPNAVGVTYPAEDYFFVDTVNNPYAATRLLVKVTAIDVANDWYQGTADIVYNYGGPGLFTAGIFSDNAFITGESRILDLNNRSGGSYVVQTLVNPAAGNASPSNGLGLVVYVPQSAHSTFSAPAKDADGDPIRWRVSSNAEAGGGLSPPNLSINPTTGVATWNSTGLPLGNWTAQVIIEDLDSNGNVQTQNPVDLVLTLVRNTIPVLQVAPANVFTVSPGSSVLFQVAGSNGDLGDTVTLTASGVPGGASVSPGLPVTSSTTTNVAFFWAPGFADLGSHTITFTATDSTGLQSSSTVTIEVVVNPTQATFLTLPPPIQTESVAPIGTSVTVTAGVTNLHGATVTVSWSVDGNLVQTATVPGGVAPTTAAVMLASSYGLGRHTLGVTATDGVTPPATATTFVTIVDTTPPAILSCPPAQTVFLDATSHSVIIPDLTSQLVATDNGTSAAALVISQTPPAGTVIYLAGTQTITFSVTDASGNRSQCQTAWTIVDNSVPQVFTAVDTPLLWPPNHDLVCVGLDYVVNKPGLAVNIQVFSNEPDVPRREDGSANGDGRFSPDAKNLHLGQLWLRAESVAARLGDQAEGDRSGDDPSEAHRARDNKSSPDTKHGQHRLSLLGSDDAGDLSGRVYLIVVTVVDSLGQSASAAVTVVVPRSQKMPDIAAINTTAAAAVATFNNTGVPPAAFVPVGVGPVIGSKQTAPPCQPPPQ
ncbi:MAG: HYR domain-containing protein [Limisphaerales bacterium]